VTRLVSVMRHRRVEAASAWASCPVFSAVNRVCRCTAASLDRAMLQYSVCCVVSPGPYAQVTPWLVRGRQRANTVMP
jgi:hypothetical protein